MSYTHLQVRSGYSLMNSTITIDKLVQRASELEFDALALTDEQVLYGAIPFYKACQNYKIKPIIGMVVYTTDEEQENIPCIFLAKNKNGYQSLVKISTHIQHRKNTNIAIEELRVYVEDLICIIPVHNTKIATLLDTQNHDKVVDYITTWKHLVHEGDFYLGIQDHGLESERHIHRSLKAFHDKYHIPVVAIQDVRYIHQSDDSAYDCLQAMKQGNTWNMRITDPDRKERFLRSAFEMEQLFSNFWPEVIEESEAIKQKCNVTFDFDQRMIPAYPVPQQMSAHAYLEKICWTNVETKYEEVTEEVSNRLTYELTVIQSMQFSDYFLIVSDFIGYAKDNRIVVGPGRGSAAGSLVAYVLGITDVDPIKYDLLFERFLNPERLTMPDIDIDFSDVRRDEVIEYVRNKYGNEHVAQIITFGTFAARSLVRELIKTMDIDQQDANFILRHIPVQARKSIVDLAKESEDLKNYIKQSDSLKVLFAISIKLEGLPRHVSTHAAGIVISEKPLMEHIPLTTGTNETNLTQFPMNDLEELGLLKIDLLGLRNLTLLEKTIQSITFTRNQSVSLTNLPKNDAKTYELLQKGETNGVFQLESNGMKNVLTQLKPSSFEDIVAVNALFRPGPMDNIPTYINRKHGKENVVYPHPDLAPILEKTYGVLVYQEQIMQIANQIAGFSLGKADILRRAVSKKQQDVMDEQKEAFINGCLANGYDKSVAEEIFAWIVKFSNYGFNRSHAVAYSEISYQLAYLKAHYPANFFAELLSSFVSQQDKTNDYIKEAKNLNLSIAPPSINKSFGKFSVEGNQIRMGLIMIKGIGNQVIKEVIKVRKEGLFKNLFDFCLRVSLKTVNRAALELLIMAGAFDETYSNRASLLASIDHAIEQGELFREFNDQPGLFRDQIAARYIDIEDFSLVKKLADEKELLGIYVSSHPLKEHRKKLRENGYVSMKQAQALIGKKNCKSVAIVQSIKPIRTKRGDAMAFITISDETGDMEAVVFPEIYRDVNRWLKEEMVVLLTGKIESRNNRVQWQLSQVKEFDEEELETRNNQRLFIKLTQKNNQNAWKEIKKVTRLYPGNIPIIIYDEQNRKTFQLTGDYFITPERACIQALSDHFGKDNVVFEK
ncbi:DNA polymerase-3 subunit alpha [Virgibacillus natechei]|uniref:DNA polymerase III subunit alpha n=1 Tax=Virgibacillus natechei TaxID=1216297 RepID=A0ABS4ID69_9BACI|nr:DNA polymerase III subunit alpha [Virgibacillus natechei]MBP1968882.1 DNA polymerase-3 subunit alpha [Virgibacillus natechei]UZD11676.1 DNA polymerase III subunit alpha [Virgibacillus natechei]